MSLPTVVALVMVIVNIGGFLACMSPLRRWPEERIANDSLPEFKELLHTLTHWREEILNYFDYKNIGN